MAETFLTPLNISLMIVWGQRSSPFLLSDCPFVCQWPSRFHFLLKHFESWAQEGHENSIQAEKGGLILFC